MNKYNAIVDDKTYHISIEGTNVAKNTTNDSDSRNISLETTKAEYDHCVQRSERLDNKIYIVLTVYAFLFVLICDIIKRIIDFHFPSCSIQLTLIITYSILLTTNIIIYVLTLIQLTHLLKGVSIERFNPQIILERDMLNKDSNAVTRYICSRYNQCIDYNNIVLESRFKKFNICVNFMVPIIIISILLILLSNFIK